MAPAGGGSKAREFKFLAALKTKRNNTVYFGAARFSGTRAKTCCARCDTQAEAASMVVNYLKSDVNIIKINKAERHVPEQSAEYLAVVSESFEGWAPADLASAVRFREQASFMQMSGPAAYVAGLLGKEDRWKEGLAQVWNAMPSTTRLRLPGLGSRDKSTAQEGARALHDLRSFGFSLCGRAGRFPG